MHDLPYLPYYLIAPMASMHVHGIKARREKKKKKPLIQHVKGKQTIKWRNRDSKNIKRNQIEAYHVKETKKQKQKT